MTRIPINNLLDQLGIKDISLDTPEEIEELRKKLTKEIEEEERQSKFL